MRIIKIKLLKKIVISLIIFFTLIFIYQITFAKNISFSNDIIDRYFYYTQTQNAIFIFFLLLCLLFLNSKQTWEKVISVALILPTFIFLLLGIFFISGVVGNDSTNVRHYFFNKDGYSYYMISEGRLNIKMYKEKPLFLFIKELKVVNRKRIKS